MDSDRQRPYNGGGAQVGGTRVGDTCRGRLGPREVCFGSGLIVVMADDATPSLPMDRTNDFSVRHEARRA